MTSGHLYTLLLYLDICILLKKTCLGYLLRIQLYWMRADIQRRLKIVLTGMHKCTFKEAMRCFVECNKKKSILIVYIVPNSILFSCYISNTFQGDKTYHSTFY